MEKPSAESAGHAADLTAGDKIRTAFDLLTSAFQDTRIDSVACTRDELLDEVALVQRVLNTAWAVQSARLAQVAAIEQTFTSDARNSRGFRETEVRHAIGMHQDEFIGSEVGPMLGWTSGQAEVRVQEATDAIVRTPRLFRRVGSGELDAAKLATIHRTLGRTARAMGADGTPVTLDLTRRVETALLGDPDNCVDADSAVLEQEHVDLLVRQSAAGLRHRTDRILKSLDPVAADETAARRRRDRVGVYAHPDDEPGLSHLHAILPSEMAAGVMAAIDKHARDLRADTTTSKTLAVCRADAIADLILGGASVTTQLVVQVPIHVDDAPSKAFGAAFIHPITGLTVHDQVGASGPQPVASTQRVMSAVLDQDATDRAFNELLRRLYPPDPEDFTEADFSHGPPPDLLPLGGERRCAPTEFGRAGDGPPREAGARIGDAIVPGVGIIPAAVIEELSRSFGMTMTRALVDAETGVTVETGETRYRPSPRLQHFIQTRDAHCRFPGCSRAAHWCDIDHVVSWPEGPTAAYNLHCLCRHHHRTKQAHGWSVTMTPAGVCTWISPSGRRYLTTPAE